MINRLVYEVRLLKVQKPPAPAKGKPWRWDVSFYKTTDPVHPGVEDGRWHLASRSGYERFRWQALRNIANHIKENPYKDKYPER